MLTLQQIKEDPERVIARLAVKGFDGKQGVNDVIDFDDERKNLQFQNDNLAAQLKKKADSIGRLMKEGNKAEAEEAKKEVAEMKEKQKELAERLATTENAIRYIDFAAENNLQGVLFEGWNEGWDTWGGKQHFNYAKAYADFDIDSIAAYAAAKGIELWAHNETGGNIPEYEAAIDTTFAYYQSLGIHTVKTGYAGGFVGGQYHHSQYGVKHYQRVVETAAKYQLMIDAHEPIKETGIRRTWPNMMTREGARGMEWNAWSAGNTPEYLCTLPFVRLLSGPMDYTPGIFDINYDRAKPDPGRIEWNGRNDYCKINTTVARQIANWVIIYSPLQMAADLIENYEGQPAFQFFRDFNADCDWSQALQGEIGKYIAIVRRAGNNFYLGAGTDSEARTLTVPLSFLGEGTYTTTVYADDPADPTKVVISTQEVTAADTLTVAMAPAGGQAVSFIPRN